MSKKLKKNVPLLRFPDFEGEWEQFDLKDIVLKITDGTHDTPQPISIGFPYLTAIHVKDGHIDFENCYYLSEEEHRKIYTRCNPEYGDILMVNIGAGTATVARIEVNFEFSLKNVALIKIKQDKLSSHFIFQILSKDSVRLRNQLTSGGAQPFFSLKQIGKLKVIIPSLAEQEKIASFVGAVDTRLNQLRRKWELLKTYKRGIMQKLFSQELRFKNAIGSEFPDWEEKSLGDIATDGFSNGVFNDPDKVGKGYRLINVKDMYEGDSINVETLSRLSIDEKEFIKNQAKYGDIFFTRSSLVKEGIAHSNVLLTNDLDITYDGHLIRFRFDIKENKPQFMALVLKSGIARKQLVARGKTGTMTTIGQEDVATVKIPIPNEQEQEKIANFLTTIDRKIEVLSRQIEKTEQFKKGLLQKLFV